MDVGNPSNFVRIQELYNNSFEDLKSHLSTFSFSDTETEGAVLELFNAHNYIADPHGAIGYLGAKAYLKKNPKAHTVVLETAHPTKFLDVVERVIQNRVEIPVQIRAVMDKSKSSIKIATYEELKALLLES
jgi:threonine synthase